MTDSEAVSNGRSGLISRWAGWRPTFPWRRKGASETVQQVTINGETVTLINEDTLIKDAETAAEGFGEKDISFFGGFCLLLNNITGPAMVGLPVLYQQAGYITPSLCMIGVMIIACFSCTMLCKAMALVPGNDRFQGRVELSTVAKLYFNRWGYYITLLLLIISLQATNISSIIISAQTMDFALVAMFKYTCGWEFYPHFHFNHVAEKGTDISPFGDVIIISLGFLIVLILTMPMGYFNLDDNIWIQIGACSCMLTIVLGIWMADFVMVGLEFDRVQAWGSDQSQVLGTIIFNYAFVTAVPSWVNEKRDNVSINKSVWGSTALGTFIFIAMGIVGGWAFFYPKNDDILDVINTESKGRVMKIIAEVSVYLFPIVVLLSSIPVYSIIVRYNLIQSGWCGKHWANVWAVLFPWVVAVPFYTGSGLSNIIGWVGLFVNGLINFIIPLILYIIAVRRSKDPPLTLQIQDPDESPAIVYYEDLYVPDRGKSASIDESDPAYLYSQAEGDLSGIFLYDMMDDEEFEFQMEPFEVLPGWVEKFLSPTWLAVGLSVLITLGILATIGLDLYNVATGKGGPG